MACKKCAIENKKILDKLQSYDEKNNSIIIYILQIIFMIVIIFMKNKLFK